MQACVFKLIKIICFIKYPILWYILSHTAGWCFFMFKRNLFSRLLESMSTSFVVLLTGARQTGKTTLMERIVKEKGYTYSTFDDLRTLAAAKEDPIGFISDLKKPTILDEVQRVPEVFLPVFIAAEARTNSSRIRSLGEQVYIYRCTMAHRIPYH